MSLATFAAACKLVALAVLPFDPPHVYNVSYYDLNRLASLQGTIGLVITNSYIGWNEDDCTLTVGYANPKLYVVSELVGNQCAFEHVLKHEEEHVAIYRRHLATLRERVVAVLARKPADLAAALFKELDAPKADHQRHDSPAEYRRNLTVCGGVIPKLTEDH